MSATRTEAPLDPPVTPWGIGWYPTPEGSVAYTATGDDIEQAAADAEPVLGGLGVGHGDVVVYVGRAAEAIQFAPFERATNRLGAAYSCADAFRFEGHRLRSLVALFAPRAVLGLDEQLLLGLADLGVDAGALLKDVPVVAARPKAREDLRRRGLDPVLWLHAGPAVALECRERSGAHLAARWQPETRDGSLRVVAPDGTSIDTALAADVVTARCGCGSDMPRVVLRDVPDFVG